MSNDPIPTRDEIEQSQRICEAAKGPWPHEGARQHDLLAFHYHAKDALPRANASLLKLIDLLPYVQHMPGCVHGSNYAGMTVVDCDCGLEERLAALGLGERREGGGG